MAKNFTASEDQLQPDAKYGSLLVSKFVNCMMKDGKKSVALRVFYDALDIIKKKLPEASELEVFQQAVDNVKPSIQVRSKRVGGATYQVPTPVGTRRQRTLAIRWIIEACRGRKGRGIAASLSEEFMAAYKREGAAMTKRENVHKMADANKAFAHFAW